MARRGDIIENPMSGETVIWHETTQDTGGRKVRLEIITKPGGGVPAHVHVYGEERFEVLAGRIGLRVGDGERELGPGERAVVPAGAAHRWWNASDEELRFMVELEPPGGFEDIMDTMFALGRAGRLRSNGMPHTLDLAVIAQRHGYDTVAAGSPAWLQKAILTPLAVVGRALGRGQVAA